MEAYGFKSEYIPGEPFLAPPQPLQNLATHNIVNVSMKSQEPAYHWIESSSAYGSIPPTALQGGVDIDGHPIYVGRAYHEGNLIPCKVIPAKNAAYVCYAGEEHPVQNYQVLCEQRFEWVPSHGGHVPGGAVLGGQTSEGEPLYIGRAYHAGSQTVGKVHPSHGVCYIAFDGKEVACSDYETLVLRST